MTVKLAVRIFVAPKYSKEMVVRFGGSTLCASLREEPSLSPVPENGKGAHQQLLAVVRDRRNRSKAWRCQENSFVTMKVV